MESEIDPTAYVRYVPSIVRTVLSSCHVNDALSTALKFKFVAPYKIQHSKTVSYLATMERFLSYGGMDIVL